MPPAASRQERQLQRQRGAAKRKVQNTTGFDLVIPGQDAAPLEPRRSGRFRQTPQPELLPQRSSRRTPAPKTLSPQKSTRTPPGPDGSLAPQRSTRRTPGASPSVLPPSSGKRKSALNVTGKRKRPTGEAMFDVPESPKSDSAVGEVGGQRVDEELDVHDNEPDVGQNHELSNISESMEVNDSAPQKPAMKKRKKRKSIGQQAPRRAKEKASINQTRMVTDVKPEPISPSAQPEGSSRLDEYPAENEDPAEAQIQQEFAGAAARSLHDSLMEDTRDDRFMEAAHKGNRNPSAKDDIHRKMPKKRPDLEESDAAIDPHLYSLPISQPTAESVDASNEQEREDDEGIERGGEAEVNEPQDVEADRPDETKPITAPTQQPKATKPKRKKRKSIGQQRPKRPSTGKPANTTSITMKKSALYPPEKPPKPTSKSSKRPPSTAPKSGASKPRGPPANAVPITIYRPPPQPQNQYSKRAIKAAKADADDDDEVEDEGSNSSNSSDPDLDPLTAPLPPISSTTITPIDVLSQLTRELVAKTAANTSLSARARRTIEMYGQELETRMKQLGQAMATNSGLAKRLRAVNAEARRLKGEIQIVDDERKGVRERIAEARELEKGVKLGALMRSVKEVARRGWELEREREMGEGVG